MGKTLNFLTGLPRSGTTWLADIIGEHKSINFLSGEVFNSGTSPVTFGLDKFPWFVNETSIPKQLENNISKALLLEKDYLFFLKRYGILLKYGIVNPKNYLRLLKHLMFLVNKKPVFTKDPIGLFMVDYLYNKYNAKIVVMKRDPYRFAASMKRVNWYLNFDNLPFHYKNKYESEIDKYTKPEFSNDVSNNIIWWLIFNEYIQDLKKRAIPFLLVEHEQILENPKEEISKVLSYYGVKLDTKTKRKIVHYIKQKERKNFDESEIHQMNRSWNQILDSWKNYLSKEEITFIYEKTGIIPPY
ncbi:sulfotransferase [Mangrovimonas sp. DI 80]|uniref:sulfotransferase family protein n=1 Tax=Mangrovimonas sp. DI 80 TaxID=1779330 RepID=UPI0009789C0A|nr:sulfotransferase [Mangrovimonas sp. DI 80]OMP31779.1 hypothetical protein BKM32_01585 [Mangrovimonas sp. DI 80]